MDVAREILKGACGIAAAVTGMMFLTTAMHLAFGLVFKWLDFLTEGNVSFLEWDRVPMLLGAVSVTGLACAAAVAAVIWLDESE